MNRTRTHRAGRDAGFTLIEILIVVAIMGLIMTAAFSSFVKTMRHAGQQSDIADTRMETGTGMEVLRMDLESAGFGLPWSYSTTPVYTEPNPMKDAPNGVPRPFLSQDNYTNTNSAAGPVSPYGADYLVIRATNAVRNGTSQRWGTVGRDAGHAVDIQQMGPPGFPGTEDFTGSDRVLVIRPESSPGKYRELVMLSSTNYFTQGSESAMTMNQSFVPMATPNDPDGEKYLIYGLSVDNNVKRPFNRTDYYLSSASVPAHCAPNTGVLVKVTASQTADSFSQPLPIVDCVADFQIVYYLDTNQDGGWETRAGANGLNGYTAEQIRERVKLVRAYILTHEGSIDNTYTLASNTISVGEVQNDGTTLYAGAGRTFNLSATIGVNWANYRWKVYSMSVTPNNLK